MNEHFTTRIGQEVEDIKASGLYKIERIIESPQGAAIQVTSRARKVKKQ